MVLPLKASVWNDIVEHVRTRYPDVARGWFAYLIPVDLSRGILIIGAENAAQVRYLTEHCHRPFAEAAQAATDHLVSVRFECDVPEQKPQPLSFEAPGASLTMADDYRFENFIIGPCNRLAHAAAIATAEQPGVAYNPLFIHGDVGLGKTHLLQAIYHEIKRHQPDLKLMYISGEAFTNHFLEAVAQGAMEQFRYRYRHVNLLVIDDIQFLGERERSQEEFFHTFNTLYQSQRQIILSADCCPAEIPSMQDRLISRFNSGLVVLVDRPCLETRMAIVQAKAKLRCIEIPEDVAKFIASSIDSNVRELEGALAKIDLLSHTRGGRIDMQMAMEGVGLPAPSPNVGIPDILSLVARRYDVRLSDLQGKRRTKSIVFPRQVCMYLAREMTPLSLGEIGGYFGGRDHTTVIHAHRSIKTKRSKDGRLNSTVEELTTALRNGVRA